MTNIVTRTNSTFTQIEAPVILATNTNGSLRTLNLREKFGAWIYVRMSRRVVTALLRPAYVMIRPTDDDTLIVPAANCDVVGGINTCVAPTLSSGYTAGTDPAVLAVSSATGLNPGDWCAVSAPSAVDRAEWNRITSISGTNITFERAFRSNKNTSDLLTNLADVQRMFVPGGDHYEIRCINPTAQSIMFAVDAVIDNSETIT